MLLNIIAAHNRGDMEALMTALKALLNLPSLLLAGLIGFGLGLLARGRN